MAKAGLSTQLKWHLLERPVGYLVGYASAAVQTTRFFIQRSLKRKSSPKALETTQENDLIDHDGLHGTDSSIFTVLFRPVVLVRVRNNSSSPPLRPPLALPRHP